MTDVLVRIQTTDGTVLSARLTPSSPSFTVPAQAGPLMVLSAYIGLGIEHILFGVDHLLFIAVPPAAGARDPQSSSHRDRLYARAQHDASRGDAGLHPGSSRAG